ncbi:MAG TPA: DUF3617 family protein [Casimicrobiaceae bacterium]|nr:DUF3617 family protein [Casimicrobiaceae bacterium]
MPFSRARKGLVLAALAVSGALAASSAVAQMNPMAGQRPLFKPGPGPDDLWDITMKMEMPGMPMAMPATTQQMCIKKNRGGADLVPKNDSDCRMTDVKTAGNKTTYTMVCTGDTPMTGKGEITSTPTSYDGRMWMKSTKRGEEFEMTQVYSGRKVGTCTDQSEQVVAQMKSDADAQVAKGCAESLETLEPALFGRDGMCQAQSKQFCDRVGGLARDMRDPGAHAAATAKYRGNVSRAFEFCRQDYASVTRAACAKGVEARNWAFVGNGSCDDDVKTIGDASCKGRSFTGMDRNLVALCNRYASITRGPANAAAPAPAPAAAKAPDAGDPLKQGVDAVRRLLPF